MPRKSKANQSTEVVESKPVETPPVEVSTNEVQQLPPNKEEYLKARNVIKQYRESQKSKPKRQCSERQLEALAKGRAKNKRFAKKQEETK